LRLHTRTYTLCKSAVLLNGTVFQTTQPDTTSQINEDKNIDHRQHRIKTGSACYLMSAKIHWRHPYRKRFYLGWDMTGYTPNGNPQRSTTTTSTAFQIHLHLISGSSCKCYHQDTASMRSKCWPSHRRNLQPNYPTALSSSTGRHIDDMQHPLPPLENTLMKCNIPSQKTFTRVSVAPQTMSWLLEPLQTRHWSTLTFKTSIRRQNRKVMKSNSQRIHKSKAKME